jgi:hypothetical protein
VSENERTVVLLEESERGGLRIKLLGSPRGKSGPSKAVRLKGLPQQLDTAEALEQYGDKLFGLLRKQPQLREALEDALRAADDDVRPLCFTVQGADGDDLSLCWELLWEKQQQFLALNRRWPIGRIVDNNNMQPSRVYRPPLRILAVMSALGEEARPEWLGLQAAVLHARGLGLPVHVTAVVGEQALLDELRATAAADPGWLTVHALTSRAALEELLKNAPPQILHFFCHGWVGTGEGRLELATIGDRAEPPEQAKASVAVSMADLRTLVRSRKLWLVTLNCCSGARSTTDVQSLAQAAVSAGAGAAVGWREAVDARDANLLCKTLYLELLGELARRLADAESGDELLLELASSSYGPRVELHSTPGRRRPVWTLPVLYLAPHPLSVVVHRSEGADEPGRHDDLERRESGGDAVRASTVASELAEADALLQAAHAPDDVRRGLRGKIHGARRRATTAARVLAGGTE